MMVQLVLIGPAKEFSDSKMTEILLVAIVKSLRVRFRYISRLVIFGSNALTGN